MKSLKNPFLILFSASLLTAFFLSFILGSQLYRYFNLSTPTPAKILSWEIRKKSTNLYRIGVHYKFQTPKGLFENFHLLSNSYPNKEAAKNALTPLKIRDYTSYYAFSNPENSALEHFFPYNPFFRWILSIVLLIYFFTLYINKNKKQLEN